MYTFHKFFYAFMRFIIKPFMYLSGFRYKTYKPKSRNYLMLCNHNTNIDFFRFGLCLKKHMYFVASEHILRMGFTSKIIKFLADPIPRRKGAKADDTIAMIKERLDKGYNVCMFVEGNRSFNGQTGWISPTNARLVRECNAGLITGALHGGYLKSPRWAKNKRKGPLFAEMVHEYTPEDIAGMTDEEILEAIRNDCCVNAFEDQKQKHFRYRGNNLAENLETALYICPCCHSVSSLRSSGDFLECTECGMKLEFTEEGFFKLVSGTYLAYDNVYDWDEWQITELGRLLEEAQPGSLLFSDRNVKLSLVHPQKGSDLLSFGELHLYKEELKVVDSDGATFSYAISDISKISVTMKCTLLFTTSDGSYFEIKSDSVYNAIKYVVAIRLLQGKEYR